MSFLIDGLSQKSFFDVSSLLLAHPSLLAEYHMHIIYAARALFPYEPFVHPGVYGSEFWERAKEILITAGFYLMVEESTTVYERLNSKQIEWLDEHMIFVWCFVVNDLWDPAQRIARLHEGAPEPGPLATTLKDVLPYFEPSGRMAQYMKEITTIDYSNAVVVTQLMAMSQITPVDIPFPRIRSLEKTTRILIP